MNRIDLQQLAQTRLREAEALLNAGEWSGAYYLAGYAVECGLKACIAKLTNLHDFPDKDLALRSYSHKVEVLIVTAGLQGSLNAAFVADPMRKQNWSTVKDWNEQSRYQLWSEIEARDLINALSNPTNGIMPWVMNHW